VLALINCSSPGQVLALDEASVQSTTPISGSATSAGVFYTPNGTTLTSCAFRIAGFIEYSGGLTTAGTYAAAPSKNQLFGPGVKLPGDIVQSIFNPTGAVATGTTVIPFDDTVPQNTEGDQYMSQAVTPKSAANMLRVRVMVIGSTTVSDAFTATLFQDSGANALAASTSFAATAMAQAYLAYEARAATTAATTFKVRAGGNNAGTLTFNGFSGGRIYGGAMASFIAIDEIMG
jgi:hypothetical protein